MFVLHEHGARVYVNDADGVAAEMRVGNRSLFVDKREKNPELFVYRYCITEKQCGYGIRLKLIMLLSNTLLSTTLSPTPIKQRSNHN